MNKELEESLRLRQILFPQRISACVTTAFHLSIEAGALQLAMEDGTLQLAVEDDIMLMAQLLSTFERATYILYEFNSAMSSFKFCHSNCALYSI